MAKPGDVLNAPSLGVRIEFRRTTEETGGALLEFDVVGRSRGVIAQPHVHPDQTERHQVIDGSMRMKCGGRARMLGPGEVFETPAGQGHRHIGDRTARVRVQIRPAGRTEAWLERIAAMDRDGQFLRGGWPRPVAAARMIRDFKGEAHPAGLSPHVQHAVASGVLRAHGLFDSEYVFADEWDVAAPPEAVFDALADAKERLPYRLNTRSTTVRHERPHLLERDVEGDLRGRGTWTLTPLADSSTHVRFDWRASADRPLLRILTPVLRPAFRWNHARAKDGLEPFAQQLAAGAREPERIRAAS